MKKQFLTSLVLAVVLIPQISFAAWWNPISWFKKPANPAPIIQIASTTPATKLETQKPVVKVATSTPKAAYTAVRPKVTPQVKVVDKSSEIEKLKKEVEELKKNQAKALELSQQTSNPTKTKTLPNGLIIDEQGNVLNLDKFTQPSTQQQQKTLEQIQTTLQQTQQSVQQIQQNTTKPEPIPEPILTVPEVKKELAIISGKTFVVNTPESDKSVPVNAYYTENGKTVPTTITFSVSGSSKTFAVTKGKGQDADCIESQFLTREEGRTGWGLCDAQGKVPFVFNPQNQLLNIGITTISVSSNGITKTVNIAVTE